MKAAKADKQEIEKVQEFYSLVESLWGGSWNSDEDWRDWPDDDKDKQEMLKTVRKTSLPITIHRRLTIFHIII